MIPELTGLSEEKGLPLPGLTVTRGVRIFFWIQCFLNHLSIPHCTLQQALQMLGAQYVCVEGRKEGRNRENDLWSGKKEQQKKTENSIGSKGSSPSGRLHLQLQSSTPFFFQSVHNFISATSSCLLVHTNLCLFQYLTTNNSLSIEDTVMWYPFMQLSACVCPIKM